MIDSNAILRSLFDLAAGFIIGYYFLIPACRKVVSIYKNVKARMQNGN